MRRLPLHLLLPAPGTSMQQSIVMRHCNFVADRSLNGQDFKDLGNAVLCPPQACRSQR